MKKTFFLKTFGCTLNQTDSELLRALFLERGFREAESEERTGIVVVNTCGVKEATENKTLHYLAKLTKKRKKIIVCGCLPAMALEKIRKAAPHALAVVGTNNFGKIFEAIGSGRRIASLTGKTSEKIFLRRKVIIHSGVVAKIPIAFGCVGACSFCGTRFARGALKSVPFEQIVCEVRQAVAAGAREIRLTAQDAGCYGMDLKPKRSLSELLHAVNRVGGRFFVRVGMLNPEHALNELNELIAAFERKRIFKFLHLPIQSGSDSVLRDMKRNYSVKEFERVVAAFRKKIPLITVATDVIVGYPSETEKDFRKTLSLLKKVKPDVVNVSKFCKRPNAPASRLKPLDNRAVKERSGKASALAKRIALEKNREWIGRRCKAVVVEKGKGNSLVGRNEFYKPVVLKKGNGLRPGEELQVKIIGFGGSWLEGVAYP